MTLHNLPPAAVVVTGIAGDPVLQHFVPRALSAHRQHPWVFLDQNELGQTITITTDGIQWPDHFLAHNNIHAIYNRSVGMRTSDRSGDVWQQWLNWQRQLDHCYPLVVNRPQHGMSNFIKTHQLQVAHELGWTIPVTQLLTQHDWPENPDQWIIKSACSMRSVVRGLDSQRHGANAHEPVVCQQRISGRHWRVHVIGHHICIAHHMISRDIDYRYDKSCQFLPDRQLPISVTQLCRQTARRFEMAFCGIDLIQTDRDWYFLEANPNPGYSFFEQHTDDHAITDALINYLETHDDNTPKNDDYCGQPPILAQCVG